MCITCGCSPSEEPSKITVSGKYQDLRIATPSSQLHELEQNILLKNDREAQHNRMHLENKNVLAFNLVSAPGSGKTTLLEKTILALKEEVPIYVIEGDQQTMQDAMRIQATGAPVIQVNTGKGCHLDARMVHLTLHQLEPKENSLLFIENVGNLVCPALFDLGEKFRVVIISVTEGEDKPLKYPYMFESADVCIINKIDLIPYVDFKIEKAKEYALRVNHQLKFFEVSATKGEGMNLWLQWLIQQHTLITS